MPKITITFSCLDRLGPMPRAFIAYPNITLCQTSYDPTTAVTSAKLPLEVWRKHAKAIAQNEANKRWYVSDVAVEEEVIPETDYDPVRTPAPDGISEMSHRQLVGVCKEHRIPGYGKHQNTEALRAFVTAYFEAEPAAI